MISNFSYNENLSISMKSIVCDGMRLYAQQNFDVTFKTCIIVILLLVMFYYYLMFLKKDVVVGDIRYFVNIIFISAFLLLWFYIFYIVFLLPIEF